MSRVYIGAGGVLALVILFLWWRLDAAKSDLQAAQTTVDQQSAALDELQEQRDAARERARLADEAAEQLQQERKDLRQQVHSTQERARELERKVLAEGATPTAPADCLVTPVPTKWVPEAMRP